MANDKVKSLKLIYNLIVKIHKMLVTFITFIIIGHSIFLRPKYLEHSKSFSKVLFII